MAAARGISLSTIVEEALRENLARKDRASTWGNQITDAWLAALAIESGCEWITADRDYARFPGLRWRAPL